ncbi:MAG TPA: sigma-70 family RNA polymerase sigma factor, partial [Verrucomicrobiae bacterium]
MRFSRWRVLYQESMTPDSELLAHFVKTSSEDAFAELVRRHLGLVHAAALRQVAGDEHLARDVVQVVFTDLARKAASLTRRDSLAGWLYTSARHTAANVVRSEVRRRRREDEFMREPDQMAVADSSPAELAGEWNQLAPCLDQVMHDLKEVEREALLLRFFQNQPYAEVGARLGMNENTARMRVERALGKLRTAFARRGVVTTAALSAALSVHAAPASGLLPGAVAGSAIAGAAASASVLLPLMSATT